MSSLSIEKLLEELEAPFSSPDSAVYCLCESCQSIQEIPLDLFYELCTMDGFKTLNHLNDHLKFRQEYYLTVEHCDHCPDGPKNPEAELTIKIRKISDLRHLLKKGISSIQYQSDFPFDLNPN